MKGKVYLVGAGPGEIVQMAALASKDPERDPIEHAIFERLEGGASALDEYDVERFEPFDPVRKYSNAAIRLNGRYCRRCLSAHLDGSRHRARR